MIPFNSFCPEYRNPTGAVPQGQNVHFKIYLPKSLHCVQATLVLAHDETPNSIRYSMFWCGDLPHAHEAWECDFMPPDIGIYQYYFELASSNGIQALYKSSMLQGEISPIFSSESAYPRWQLTVYSTELQVPSWLSGGIMYQIFPDRFFCSGTPKQNIPADRILRSDWGALPNYLPNESGEITNSDYFCGDLTGITQKLDYICSLGVTCIYLNPIFEAHSNHRYNTADYSKIDPLLGTEHDFTVLCREARARGIRIMLDGVFSHTGSDSIYFNREKRYSSLGAHNDKNSHFYSWYNFSTWPNEYDSWWGFVTLPEVNELDENYLEYILGDFGIVKKWTDLGASAWRLDVADELPDKFIEQLRVSAKLADPEALILGEVWEDASNKISYGHRRSYLLGNQLDSVMNYPFRTAIIDFVTGGSAQNFLDVILNILDNYPRPIILSLMNVLSTHDTERILTRLAGQPLNNQNRQWQAQTVLSPSQIQLALKLLRIATAIQYTLPGVPCVYYGDEAAMQGYRDPFSRGCYPWGLEDLNLVDFYVRLGHVRRSCLAFSTTSFVPYYTHPHFVAYIRCHPHSRVLCLFNAGSVSVSLQLPVDFSNIKILAGDCSINGDLIVVPEISFSIVEFHP